MGKVILYVGKEQKVLHGTWKTKTGALLTGEALKSEVIKPHFEIENACWWILGGAGRAFSMLHKKSLRKIKL